MIRDEYELIYLREPGRREFLRIKCCDGDVKFTVDGKAACDIVEKLLYVLPKQSTTPGRPITQSFNVTVYFNNDISSPEFGDIDIFVDDHLGFIRKFCEKDIKGDDDLFTIVKRYFNPSTGGCNIKETKRTLCLDFKATYNVTYYEQVEGKLGDRIPPRTIVRKLGDRDILSAYTGKTAEAFVKEFAAPVKTETNGVYDFIVTIIVMRNEYLLFTHRDIPYSEPVSATRERDMNRDLMKKFFDFDDFA